MKGWKYTDNLAPSYAYKDKFTIHQEHIMWGICVMPNTFCTRILEELHVGHLGVIKMKVLARGFAGVQVLKNK